MSEAPDSLPSNQPAKTRLVFKIALVLVFIFIVLLFLPLFFMAGRMGVLGAVALGWWSFLSRTLPGIFWNWDIVGMSVLCVLLVLLLAHGFLHWITKHIASARGRNWRWPWKWTWCGLVAIALCFLVGMCVGGAAHQIGWLSSQTEGWYERKGEEFLDLDVLDGEFRHALLETDGDLKKVRQELSDSKSAFFRRPNGEAPWIQRYHFLIIIEGTNKIAGSIIFSRNATLRAHSRVIYWFGNKNDYFPMEKLPELIRMHQNQLLAL